MVRLKRSLLSAVSASPAPELDEDEPVTRREASLCSEFPRSTIVNSGPAHLGMFAVIESALREPLLAMLGVIRPPVGFVLLRMSSAPTPHGVASLIGIAFDPVTTVGSSPFGILVWHCALISNEPSRCNRTMEPGPIAPATVAGEGFEPPASGL